MEVGQVSGPADKTVLVGGVSYVIDEGTSKDIATIVEEIEQALTDRTLAKVPVLDAKRNRMTLYLQGGQVDAIVINLDQGPKPGEISP